MEKYKIIENLFIKNNNQEDAYFMKKYMRNQFIFYGIKTQKRRSLYKDFLKEEYKNKNIDWNLLLLSWDNPNREFQYFACDYLDRMKKYLKYEDISLHLMYFVNNKQWWDTIDRLDRIIGYIGLNDKRVDDLMLEWSKSSNFWLRRLAIDHQIGRKDKTNINLLEKIIINNLYSDEFFINKAIGWSLREYSKTNPTWVINFVEKHDENLNKLSKKEALKRIERSIDEGK